MNDTSTAIEALYRERLMACSGERRLIMGCSMFDTAKQIVIDSIRNRLPGIDDRALREAVFIRFYGQELGATRA